MVEIKEIFTLFISVIGIILILFLTYFSTKWISTKSTLRSKYMNIVDKIILGQNKFIAIAEIYNKYYLLSVTEKHIEILKELDDFKPLDIENDNFDKFFNKYKNQFNNRNKK